MIERLPLQITADSKKVVLQFLSLNESRTKKIIERVSSLDEKNVKDILSKVFRKFNSRHKNFEKLIFDNYSAVEHFVDNPGSLSKTRKLLLGSYFSKEYSIEAAALFNPSIVEHPDQRGLPKGSKRIIMSLRAAGEGHISSVGFRELLLDKNSEVILKNVSRYSMLPEKIKYSKDDIFEKKGKYINETQAEIDDLADSNYKCSFSRTTLLSERVIFPYSNSESVGMEDVRFVQFTDNNETCYYGTYTAYNGRTFRTQLISTRDFLNFNIDTLHGPGVLDKGLALFPEKVNSKYAVISRVDGENLYLMYSDDLYYWEENNMLRQPEEPWEYIQIGNCGSPVKTESGWILITHAVGPFRRYVISALLLDLNDPSKIIGSLKEPLIEPNEKEREGYVPNVVYSCGSMIHNDYLIIPYAMSDSFCGFCRIKVNKLLRKFK